MTGQMNESSFRVEVKATKEANCVSWAYKELFDVPNVDEELKPFWQRGEQFAQQLKEN